MTIQKDKKEVIDAINKELIALEKKYGFEAVRRICNKYFSQGTAKRKLERIIKQKERELEALKQKK